MVQVQPNEFGVGYCSGRMYVNGVLGNRTYFGNFSAGNYLFRDYSNMEINICSRRKDQEVIPPVYFGNYDAMNLMRFRGTEGIYVPLIASKFECWNYVFTGFWFR